MSLLISYVVKDASDDPEKITDGFAFPEAHADFRSPTGGGCSSGDGDDMEGTGSDAGGSTGGGGDGGSDGGCSGGCDAGDGGDGY